MARDTAFLNRLLIACSRGPARLFRNSVGVGWVGKSEKITRATTVTLFPGDVVIRSARPLHAGLTDGSGDMIGWVTREITQEMVGTRVAVFASAEAKEGTGRLSPGQKNWRDQVLAAGGVAGEVRSTDDLRELLGLPFVGK